MTGDITGTVARSLVFEVIVIIIKVLMSCRLKADSPNDFFNEAQISERCARIVHAPEAPLLVSLMMRRMSRAESTRIERRKCEHIFHRAS